MGRFEDGDDNNGISNRSHYENDHSSYRAPTNRKRFIDEEDGSQDDEADSFSQRRSKPSFRENRSGGKNAYLSRGRNQYFDDGEDEDAFDERPSRRSFQRNKSVDSFDRNRNS